jgi:hypothetical protein
MAIITAKSPLSRSVVRKNRCRRLSEDIGIGIVTGVTFSSTYTYVLEHLTIAAHQF